MVGVPWRRRDKRKDVKDEFVGEFENWGNVTTDIKF